MTRRLPLAARRTFASIDRTTGSRSGRWPLFPTCSAAAIFTRLSWISIRSAATVIRSTISWTRLFSSTGGIASHRSESLRALRRATRWSDYETAIEDMMEETATKHAPWHLIPANNKPYGRIVAFRILADRLGKDLSLDPRPIDPDLLKEAKRYSTSPPQI
jgi:hypothetical protein